MSAPPSREIRPATCKHCGHANKFGRHKCSYCSRALPVWNTSGFWVVLVVVLIILAVVV